ncbi:hypothetical protein LOK49_LG11G00814 [Camellia lanceoleosa]|uniref:Uncharacterized protein n=1 Tax=Camellia lanceoleosa TaxID=1840588 RepID=A0ACC0G879_9ERIC|nr:hypothetical protein LOK49_LG11G00814 [Camellia lanceoleosa]
MQDQENSGDMQNDDVRAPVASLVDTSGTEQRNDEDNNVFAEHIQSQLNQLVGMEDDVIKPLDQANVWWQQWASMLNECSIQAVIGNQRRRWSRDDATVVDRLRWRRKGWRQRRYARLKTEVKVGWRRKERIFQRQKRSRRKRKNSPVVLHGNRSKIRAMKLGAGKKQSGVRKRTEMQGGTRVDQKEALFGFGQRFRQCRNSTLATLCGTSLIPRTVKEFLEITVKF